MRAASRASRSFSFPRRGCCLRLAVMARHSSGNRSLKAWAALYPSLEAISLTDSGLSWARWSRSMFSRRYPSDLLKIGLVELTAIPESRRRAAICLHRLGSRNLSVSSLRNSKQREISETLGGRCSLKHSVRILRSSLRSITGCAQQVPLRESTFDRGRSGPRHWPARPRIDRVAGA